MKDPLSPLELAKAIIRDHHAVMGYPAPFPSEQKCPECGGPIIVGERNARCCGCRARLVVLK